MSSDVAYVTVPGNRDEVLKVLKDRWVSGVPVVKGEEVVGMITRADLLRNPEEDQIAMLMTRNPYVISPQSTIVEAARSIFGHGIRRLPVVEKGKLVGIVTVADIVKAIADMGIEEPIARYVQRLVVVVWSETPLPVAGEIMEYADTHACPVIDSDLNLVGMVGDSDLIAASIIEDSVEMAEVASSPDMDEWTWESQRDTMIRYYAVSRITLKNIPVKQAMVPAITAIKSSKVSECASIMRQHKIDQIPVVSAHQKLVGMLTDRALLVAMIEHEWEKK
ncbi:MAG: CBS domain-containing protein [Methanosarcinales archaeon]|nr:CBS domain-containing protein [Methanosarcinales archaeon]